jgi:hypothetical protein
MSPADRAVTAAALLSERLSMYDADITPEVESLVLIRCFRIMMFGLRIPSQIGTDIHG